MATEPHGEHGNGSVEMPKPTTAPLVLSAGVALMALGLIAGTSFLVIGGIVLVVGLGIWVSQLLPGEGHMHEALAGPEPAFCEVVVDPRQGYEPRVKSRELADGTIVSPNLEDMFPYLSQEELAQRAGVERSWLALTELGRTRITGPHVHASVQRKLDRIEAVLEHRRAEKDAEHWASNQFETLNHASVLEGDLTHDSLLTVQDEIIEAQDQLIHRLRERLAFKDKEVAEKNVGVRILEERLLELHAKRRSFSAR